MKLLARLNTFPMLFTFAVLCFIPTLFYFYVGEEGIFTINTMEMWQRHEFMGTVMYGGFGMDGGRPPLFNWLMMPIANLIGWENVLVASRMVTIASTVTTSLIIAWLAQQLWRDKTISWVAAILYLVTVDIMLDHGWQSYADPLFSMFIVLAISQAWIASQRNSYLLLAAAMVAAFAAFMTKAYTVYVFLGFSMLVLMIDSNFRRFLLSPKALAIYMLSILMPYSWLHFGTHYVSQNARMFDDMRQKLGFLNVKDYVIRLIAYPAEMLLRLMPSSFFIAYFLVRQRVSVLQNRAVRLSMLIALANYLPYLIAPQGGVRYVLPAFAFVVLAAAYLVVQKSSPFKIKKWIVVMLCIGFVARVILIPYYQKITRGENYAQMAQEIIAKYGQHPLYISDGFTVGLSVAANIDSMRFPHPALIYPPADFKDGIVIAHSATDVPGTLLRELHVNYDSVYLICRGVACDAAKD
jgi:hypothetical protein